MDVPSLKHELARYQEVRQEVSRSLSDIIRQWGSIRSLLAALSPTHSELLTIVRLISAAQQLEILDYLLPVLLYSSRSGDFIIVRDILTVLPGNSVNAFFRASVDSVFAEMEGKSERDCQEIAYRLVQLDFLFDAENRSLYYGRIENNPYESVRNELTELLL